MPDLPNTAIAALFDELGDLYELDGASIHRVMAYRTAAKTIREAPRSVAALTREGRVTELPGIGKTLEEKLGALVLTGQVPALEGLRARFPAGLLAMTRLPGLGPKRARKLFDELGIDSLDALREAAEGERLRSVKGFGPKFEAQVLSALEAGLGAAPKQRTLLSRALPLAEGIRDALRSHPAADRVELAGSARRLTDTVKDLDLIATASDPRALLQAFAELELVEPTGAPGDNAARALTHTGLDVDLRVVEPALFGNLLQHFTGSKMHNVALREAAVRRGISISEYGLQRDGTTHRCAAEEEVYELLGLPWIPPELREDRGELRLGPGEVPRLVELADLRGDLHMHTVASDGRGTIEDMALAARERGYEYLCITDHSATHGFGNHVPPDELRRQIERVRAADAAIEGITVLIGTETNVLPDGRPDYDDDLLAELDWVVASVHTAFQMPRDAMTDRIVAAIEHPSVCALGHPTGRKLGRREGYAVDLERVVEAAARTGTCLEINGAPDRRDLDDVQARAAADAGVQIVLDSDAHGPDTLGNVRWAVATARRAWLTPEQVANTRPWPELRASVKGGG